jgi:hypothetical protein
MNSFEYFKSHEVYFWEWDPVEDLICIRGGNVICYNAPLLKTITLLSSDGLPPFGVLLLTLAATSKSGHQSLREIEALANQQIKSYRFRFDAAKQSVAEGLDFLRILADLPNNVKDAHKLELLQTLFNGAHKKISLNKSTTVAKFAERQLLNGDFSWEKLVSGKPADTDFWEKEFRIVALLSRKFPDAKSILDALKVPEIDSPIVVPGITETAEPLMDLLFKDEKTFPVAALVKNIWTGLKLPSHQHLRDDQSFGSIANITNKGQLNQLLISEFANEDFVFLSRLANYEALYLQRDTPPRNDTLQRIVLIDISIKAWGTPKTIALAIALALSELPKSKVTISVYTIGRQFQPVEANSVEGLKKGLSDVDISIDASIGLQSFLENIAPDRTTEVLLVTPEEGADSEAMTYLLAENWARIHYLVHTTNAGKIQLFRHSRTGKYLLDEFAIDLQDSWKRKRTSDDPPVETGSSTFNSSYPIGFPLPPGKIVALPMDNAVFAIYKKHLFQLSSSKHGKSLRMLKSNFTNSANHFAIGKTEQSEYLILCFNQTTKQTLIYNLVKNEKVEIPFPEWKPSPTPHFFFYEHQFHFMNQIHIWSFDLLRTDKPERGRINFDVERNEAYKVYAELIEKCQPSLTEKHRVIGRLKTVEIKDKRKLIINGWQLFFKESEMLFSEHTAVFLHTEMATINGARNIATFKDGRKVILDGAGMLTFLGPDGSPPIYIPAVTTGSIAAATEGLFAGNEKYKQANTNQSTCSPLQFYEASFSRFILPLKNR